MSPTQHQLIQQCATRLRGIVEALDNIHDTSPQRWSTDLDDVHSSAESLLAMIKDQAPPSEDQLIAAGLSYPLAKEDAVKLWYAGFRSEVVTVLEAWEAIGHDTGINPDKEELLESLRNMAAICNAHGNDMPAQSAIDQRQVIADAITGALAFGAQASQPPAADHWLRPFYDIGRAEGQRTQDLAMLVRMLASSLKRHAPESNLVARATNYLAAKGLAGAALAQHSPAQAEQAEAERPEAVAWQYRVTAGPQTGWSLWHPGKGEEFERSYTVERRPLMTVAQHERIVGELRAVIAQLRQHKNDYMDSGQETYRALQNEIREREAEIARLDGLVSGRTAERDAALARVAELERQEPVALANRGLHAFWVKWTEAAAGLYGPGIKLYAAPVALAQHSVPDGAADLCRFLAKLYCELDGLRYSTAKLPAEQIADALIFKWPVLQGARNQLNIKRISEQPYDESKLHSAIAAMLAAAPGTEVPQAWLDVQAERRRQVTAEGWTPEHDDLYCAAELPRAAAAYILNGANDEAPAIWPFSAKWWKPRDARSNYVRASALILAEIERLDRAAPGKEGNDD
ncbi:TPA: hypothetical protein ACGKFX_004297 [Pseudomonas aeruginosa]